MDATDLLRNVRLLPVIVIEDAALAPELARTLQQAGVEAVEITLRTTAALDARAMKDAAPTSSSAREASAPRRTSLGSLRWADNSR